MVYSAVFAFILPILLYDNSEIEFKVDYVGRTMFAAGVASIWVYIWFANGNYQTLQYTNYHDLAYFQTLATQVKSMEGYTPDLKVALVGNHFDDSTFVSNGLMDEWFDIDGKNGTNINFLIIYIFGQDI